MTWKSPPLSLPPGAVLDILALSGKLHVTRTVSWLEARLFSLTRSRLARATYRP